MAIPFSFSPTTVIESAQVNQNFSYLENKKLNEVDQPNGAVDFNNQTINGVKEVVAESGQNLVLKAGAGKQTSLHLCRNDNGVISNNQNLTKIVGWNAYQGSGNEVMLKEISFGKVFASPPVVVANFMGEDLRSLAEITDISNINDTQLTQQDNGPILFYMNHITTTHFKVYLKRDSGSWQTDRTYGFSWEATGVLA